VIGGGLAGLADGVRGLDEYGWRLSLFEQRPVLGDAQPRTFCRMASTSIIAACHARLWATNLDDFYSPRGP